MYARDGWHLEMNNALFSGVEYLRLLNIHEMRERFGMTTYIYVKHNSLLRNILDVLIIKDLKKYNYQV